jgi:D-tyrosyl-tRNA(Tyr) deacylase
MTKVGRMYQCVSVSSTFLILIPLIKQRKWFVRKDIDAFSGTCYEWNMKALIQRVSSAKVKVENEVIGEIDRGLLVFVCAVKGDMDRDVDYLAKKISQLRIFPDEQGKMNRSLMEIGGAALIVSQFTLAASVRRGNRPSFDTAELPDRARMLYDNFVQKLSETGFPVQTGEFAASMAVSLVNDGPVTLFLDSREE